MSGRNLWLLGFVQLVFAVCRCTGQSSANVQPQLPSNAVPQSPIAKEDLVVTVSAQPIPVSATSASVTVISQQQIRESGASTVSDILRQVPFLHLQRAGGQGGLTTLYIRGAKENLVMVMVDGVPLNDTTNTLGGSFDFSTLSTDNIERIEIIRGPMSSMYGSEAVAGVINIISRHHEDTPFIEFNAEAGNSYTGEFGASAVGKFRLFDYSLGGSYMTVGEQIGLDKYDLGTLAFSSTADLGKQRFLQLTFRYQSRESAGYPEGSGGPEYAIVREAEQDHSGELVGGITYQQRWKPWWSYGVDFDAFHRSDHNFTPAIWDQDPPTIDSLPSSLGNTDFQRLHFGVSNTFRLSAALTAHLGIGWRAEDGTNQSVISGTVPFSFHLDRDSLDVNPELVYLARRFTATAGLDIDKTGGFHNVLSPRLGVNYLLTQSTRVKGTWGKGFFLPSFYALSEPAIGNPNLRPEYSQSFDIGVERALRRRAQISATYFHDAMTNLVDFDSETFQLVNRDKVVTQGMELGAGFDVTSRLHLGGDVSYLHWALEGTTQPLRYVPHWQGGVNLDWKINRRLHSRVETLVVGPRFDFQIPVPNIDTAGGYSTTNLILNYEVKNGLTAHLRAENLLNSQYHEYVGFPNPGIYVRAGITYRFNLSPP